MSVFHVADGKEKTDNNKNIYYKIKGVV